MRRAAASGWSSRRRHRGSSWAQFGLKAKSSGQAAHQVLQGGSCAGPACAAACVGPFDGGVFGLADAGALAGAVFVQRGPGQCRQARACQRGPRWRQDVDAGLDGRIRRIQGLQGLQCRLARGWQWVRQVHAQVGGEPGQAGAGPRALQGAGQLAQHRGVAPVGRAQPLGLPGRLQLQRQGQGRVVHPRAAIEPRLHAMHRHPRGTSRSEKLRQGGISGAGVPGMQGQIKQHRQRVGHLARFAFGRVQGHGLQIVESGLIQPRGGLRKFRAHGLHHKRGWIRLRCAEHIDAVVAQQGGHEGAACGAV